jgi:O-antigen/teichoic acid export membrane protein
MGFDVIIIGLGAAVFSGMAFVGYLFSIAYGRGRGGWFASKDALRAFFRILFLFVGFTTLGLWGGILGLVFVEIILIVIGLGLVWSDLLGDTKDIPLGDYLKNASQFWAYDMLFTVYHALSVYLAQLFTQSYIQIGYYSFGTDFGRFASVFLGSIGVAALPFIIELITDGENQRVRELVERGTKYLSAIAPILILWGIFLIPPVINLIVPSFLASVSIAQIALLWVFPVSISLIFSRVVLAKEKPVIVIRARVLSLCAFLLLAFFIGPTLGILGIAIAYTCGQILDAIWTVWGASRQFALGLPKRTIIVSVTLAFLLWIGITLLSLLIPIPLLIFVIPFLSMYIIIWVPLSVAYLSIASIVYLGLLIGLGALSRKEFKEILYAIVPLGRKES